MQAFDGADAWLDAWLEDDRRRQVQRDPSLPRMIRKPPFADGDFMTGTVEGESPGFTVDPARTLGKRAWDVAVHAPPESNLAGWAVTVRVVEEQRRCAIDEIRYDGIDDGQHTLTRWLQYRGIR